MRAINNAFLEVDYRHGQRELRYARRSHCLPCIDGQLDLQQTRWLLYSLGDVQRFDD